jgi:septal ring factor EnvC (AmiA/AmiB activator)
MTFTEEQQKPHRTAFIEECKQKAWGAACNADWISGQLEKMIADYTKLTEEDDKFAAEIKGLETAIDYHTKENRDKRKALQERRNGLTAQKEFLGRTIQEGQANANRLYGTIETHLALAKHAETWEWKEAQPNPSESAEPQDAPPEPPAQ